MDVPVGPAEVDLAVGQAAHAGADGGRVARPHAGVGDDDDVAARAGRACAPQQRGEVRRAGLLLALDEQLEVDGRAGAAGGRQVRPDAEGVEEDLALVVGRAAGVAAGRRRTVGSNGGCSHRSSGVDGLHVVVAVDQRRSARPGRRCGHSAKTAGRPCGLPDLDDREAGVPQACASQLGASGVRRRAWAGSPEMDGMRSHSTRSATKSSAPASTASRTAAVWSLASVRWLMRRTLRPGVSVLRGPSASVGAMRVATFNLLHGRSLTDGQVRDGRPAARRPRSIADVVGLQEVDRAQDRSGGVDQTALVADGAGRRAGAGSSRPSTARRAATWTPSTQDDGVADRTARRTASAWSPGYRCWSWRVRRFGPAPIGMPLLVPGSRGLTRVPTSRGSRWPRSSRRRPGR